MKFNIEQVASNFNDWPALLELLQSAFAFQHDRIDPPSSLHKLNQQTIIEKVQQETVFIATKDSQLIGCVFVKKTAELESLYVGKLAILPQFQGQGIGKQLMQTVESYALKHKYRHLELQVRIELAENQSAFSKMGFVKIAETAHPGYESATSVTMQKPLS